MALIMAATIAVVMLSCMHSMNKNSKVNLEDERVKALAQKIIVSQEKEIKEMQWLLEDIRTNGVAQSETDAAQRPVPSF